MPSSLVGLLLLAVLALPGLAYVAVRERASSERRPTAFRETATVVIAGLVSDLAALGVFALARVSWPAGTPDVGRLVREGAAYLRAEYDRITLWGIGLLVLACILAALAAWVPDRLGRLRRPAILARWARQLNGQRSHPAHVSAWWMLFDTWRQDRAVHVQCTLDDGSYVEGRLRTFNTSPDDAPIRDLILADPRYRPPASTQPGQPTGAGAMCVSAGRIVTMSVSYYPDPDHPAGAA